jgi:hypothetical protein
MRGILSMMTVEVVLAPLRLDILVMEHLLQSARSVEMVLRKAQRLEMMGTILKVTVAVTLAR